MEYPIVMKRKRTGSIVINALLLVFSVVMLIYGIINGESVLLYSVSTAVFALSLGFNVFLACEKTLVIDKDRIYTASVFMPKLNIEVAELRGAEYSGEDGSELKINYDLPEYNVRSILGDVEIASSKNEGLWNYTIYKKDVDRPLSEVKFLIQDIIITRDNSLT